MALEAESIGSQSRRALLARIGALAGGATMYQAMAASLGHAAESFYQGPIRLEGDPRGASVLILGAGLAGMVAALELKRAGHRVQIPEYNDRAGGRCWAIRGEDRIAELGGEVQDCRVDEGHYFNPGPWQTPSTITLCSITAGVSALPWNPSFKSITTHFCMAARPSAARRSATARYCRITMAASRNCSPRPPGVAPSNWTSGVGC